MSLLRRHWRLLLLLIAAALVVVTIMLPFDFSRTFLGLIAAGALVCVAAVGESV